MAKVPIGRIKPETRWRQIARAFDELHLLVPTLDIGHVRRSLFKLERQLIVLTRGSRERRELHRRATERYVNECLERRAPWRTALQAIQMLDKVGYTNVDRRVHTAILLGMYALEFSVARELALFRLSDALSRLRKLGRGNAYRRHYERSLAQYLSALNNAA
jgi:hypothetical protein